MNRRHKTKRWVRPVTVTTALAITAALLPAGAAHAGGTAGVTASATAAAPAAATGAQPNVVYIVLDDMGFSDLGSYGSEIKTPNIDKLAAGGLRYTNFHATPLCSPTRASLLTGRNPQAVGMGSVANVDLGPEYPHTRGRISPTAATAAEVLKGAGYTTLGVGKWHQAPLHQATPAGPFENWPLGKGFQRYYGFLDGYTDQYAPQLIEDNHVVDPPKKEDYHLTEDLAEHASRYVSDHVSVQPDKPFFLYWGLGAQHAPHQVPQRYADLYKGVYEAGWDRIREERFERQKKIGLIPPDTPFPARDAGIAAWSSLSQQQKDLYVRYQQTYAGMLTQADEQIGRFLDDLRKFGKLDNTLIYLISDNGASKAGGENGSIGYSQSGFGGGGGGTLEDKLESIEELGAAGTYTEYPVGWAQVSATPFRQYKGTAYNGGVQVPLIVHWPGGIKDRGALRTQFHHVSDLTPTVYEVLGITPPQQVNGTPQQPITGTSLAYTFSGKNEPTRKKTQFFLMNGNRAIWSEGWKAVALRKPGVQLEEEAWELFDTRSDYNESRNLAQQYPEKLKELKKIWDEEARNNGAYPIANGYSSPAVTGTAPIRSSFIYYTGLKHIGLSAAPKLKGISYEISIPIQRKEVEEEGVLVAAGGSDSGYTLYLKKNELIYEFHQYGKVHRIVSDTPVPAGKAELKFVYTRAGEKGGSGALYVNGRKAGETVLPFTDVRSTDGLDIGRDTLLPVSLNYGDGDEFPFTGLLEKVEFKLYPSADSK
ncbi:arylsulfatase [Paenibacillus sp. FJAT-26967]|uniref:arylsulfatase n=1 Tax=Paenibacillus sp. FJAT-26967 TaxID=1729690 RepID=UPI0008394920|nr:arylsulfatase [Paenibacillus sp. FJAT-26967]